MKRMDSHIPPRPYLDHDSSSVKDTSEPNGPFSLNGQPGSIDVPRAYRETYQGTATNSYNLSHLTALPFGVTCMYCLRCIQSRMPGAVVAIAIGMAIGSPAASILAGDWPQILGPARNGRAENETLAESWPTAGPKTIWRRDVGSGYAGVAVVGDACILFHRLGDQAIVERLDATSGKPQWKKSFPTRYDSTIAPDNGPRCTPLVDHDRVYLFGADGDLRNVISQWSGVVEPRSI